mmetsp:Transcript_19062/g.30296  ORF Transcript_19062/g.30296 Transcript_19062/m.30296 type:complete len:131 (+) Transcript_19062:876-1268(+)
MLRSVVTNSVQTNNMLTIDNIITVVIVSLRLSIVNYNIVSVEICAIYLSTGEPLFMLSALQVATESLQGAFDCIPFFLTPDVRRKMYSCVIGCTDLEQEEQERETESSSFANYIDHSSSDNSKSNMVHVL